MTALLVARGEPPILAFPMGLDHFLSLQTSKAYYNAFMEMGAKEFDFFTLFQVDHDNMEEIIFALCWHFKSLSTDDIDKWPFYRYETWVMKLKDILDEQKSQHDKQSAEQQERMPNTSSMMGQASSMQRSMANKAKPPSMGTPKLPSGYRF